MKKIPVWVGNHPLTILNFNSNPTLLFFFFIFFFYFFFPFLSLSLSFSFSFCGINPELTGGFYLNDQRFLRRNRYFLWNNVRHFGGPSKTQHIAWHFFFNRLTTSGYHPGYLWKRVRGTFSASYLHLPTL
jgi:hypothetical protein